MAQRCGWCAGEGCKLCPGTRRRYFPKAKPAAKKQPGYAFERAHKCGPETQEHLYTKGSLAYYLCECGKMIKTEV